MRILRSISAAAVLALVVCLLPAFSAAPAPAASAADGRQFQAGNIISDALFFDGSSMNAGQVQNFLNSQVSGCRAGYTCLKDFTQATFARAGESGRCASYPGGGVESAATIVTKVGVACGISQKVLVVLLEKEQGLVTDDWPTDRQYRSATGYGCPDTADCDSTYYGFFNQVWMAALQFKRYAANPTGWNHIAGRVNNVRFSPNAACGTSPVFIQNQATAGLYNYTPYQPNAAALTNLYGTGDGCSAYGNRNFWRIFTDWFGSTTGASSLARTVDNGTVFVLAGRTKYPVASLEMLSAFAPLGPVGFVSQSYLDGFSTGPVAGRILRGPDGSIYFFDAGIKLPFATCGLVADYGGSCASTGYMQLTDAQLSAFATGPLMSSVLGTVEGARYYITLGTKREILDDASQLAAGVPLGYNVLTEAGVASLGTGTPIVRDGVFATSRATSTHFLLSGGQAYPVDASAASAAGLPGRSAGQLWATSLQAIPTGGMKYTGVVRATGTSTNSVLSQGGRLDWVSGPGANLPFVPVSPSFLAGYPTQGTLQVSSFVKGSSATVYIVSPTDLRPIASWDALLSMTPAGSAPSIVSVPDAVIAGLPTGPTALAAGALARTAGNATIYLVNGVTNKIPISSFDTTNEAGITRFSFVADSVLAGYPDGGAPLSYGILCGATTYASAGGAVHEVSSSFKALYPMSYTALDMYTCAQLKVGSAAGHFIHTPDGTIYLLSAGQKLPVATMTRFAELNGPAEGYLNVSSGFGAVIPTGPLA